MDKQTGKLIARIAENLPDMDGKMMQNWIDRPKKLQSFLLGLNGQGKTVSKTILPFLRLLRTVQIVDQSAITTGIKYFKEAGVRWMKMNFRRQFLGLEVEATEGDDLAIHELGMPSLDVYILAELGGKAEISISQFTAFLLAMKHESCEDFIFYLRGKDGNLWAVRAWGYTADSWHVEARSVNKNYPCGWPTRSQIVSHY